MPTTEAKKQPHHHKKHKSKEPPKRSKYEIARDFVNNYHQPIPYEICLAGSYATNTLENIEKCYIPAIRYESKILGLKTYGQLLPIAYWPVWSFWLRNYEDPPLPTLCMIETKKHDFAADQQIGRRSYKWRDKAGTYFVKFETYDRHIMTGKGPTLQREIEFLLAVRYAQEKYEHQSHFLELLDVSEWRKNQFMIRLPWCDTLEDVMKKVEGKFSQPTSLYIASQTLEAIHDVHKHGYIHCEVCPSNFLVGLNANHRTIYIIGFHIAYKHIDDGVITRIPQRMNVHYKYSTKSILFASRDYHMGEVLTPMNDLESWLYTAMYCFNPGFLPWKDDWNRARDETTPLYTASEHAKSERIIFEKKNHFFNFGYQQNWGVLKPYIAAIVNYIESPLFEIMKKVDFAFVMRKIHEIAMKINADLKAPLDWEPSSDGTTNQMRQSMFDARRKERMEIAKKRFELKPSTGKSPQKQSRKASNVQRTQEDDENNNVFVSVSKKSSAKSKSKAGMKQPRKASSVQRTQKDEGDLSYVSAESQFKQSKMSKLLKDRKKMAAAISKENDYETFQSKKEVLKEKQSKASKVIPKPKKAAAADQQTQEESSAAGKSKKETSESSKTEETSNDQDSKAPDETSTPKDNPQKKHAPAAVVAAPAQAPDESKTPTETSEKYVTASEKKDVSSSKKL